jgi:hypothetical protein
MSPREQWITSGQSKPQSGNYGTSKESPARRKRRWKGGNSPRIPLFAELHKIAIEEATVLSYRVKAPFWRSGLPLPVDPRPPTRKRTPALVDMGHFRTQASQQIAPSFGCLNAMCRARSISATRPVTPSPVEDLAYRIPLRTCCKIVQEGRRLPGSSPGYANVPRAGSRF